MPISPSFPRERVPSPLINPQGRTGPESGSTVDLLPGVSSLVCRLYARGCVNFRGAAQGPCSDRGEGVDIGIAKGSQRLAIIIGMGGRICSYLDDVLC